MGLTSFTRSKLAIGACGVAGFIALTGASPAFASGATVPTGGGDASTVVAVQGADFLPGHGICGPERDGEVVNYQGSLWECSFVADDYPQWQWEPLPI